jgi:hypothetical protein
MFMDLLLAMDCQEFLALIQIAGAIEHPISEIWA